MSYTIENLRDVEDPAARHGFGERQESRFPAGDLGAHSIGMARHRVKPGQRQAFAHRHERAEEVYVVLGGSGRVKLDDAVEGIGPLDAVRVAPDVVRAFEAGDDGLEVLAFGPRHHGDAELIHDDVWAG